MAMDACCENNLKVAFLSLRPHLRRDLWSNPSLLMYGRQNNTSLNQTSESLFQGLGFYTIDSMDISDFEGANITHDLNYPIPQKLKQQYNCVFDGGTSEHVFDVKSSLFNTHELLKVGGVAIHAVPINNLVNHGFYQFSPALFFGFYEQNGYKIHMIAFSVNKKGSPGRTFYGAFSDGILEMGLNARIIMPQDFTPFDMIMMFFVAIKPETHREPVIPQQPIYSQRFSGEKFNKKRRSILIIPDGNRPEV